MSDTANLRCEITGNPFGTDTWSGVPCKCHSCQQGILIMITELTAVIEALKKDDSLLIGLYKHYKGGFYQCLGLAADCDTDERVVVSVALYLRPGPRLRTVPLAKWLSDVEDPKDSTRIIKRFTYVGAEVTLDNMVKHARSEEELERIVGEVDPTRR